MSVHPRRDCQCPRARHQHGTLAAYRADRCRCFRCRLAKAESCSRWSRGLSCPAEFVPAAGMRRRLEALHALGWSAGELGQRLGTTKQAVRCMTTVAYTLPATSRRVADLYDEIWDKTPTNRYAVRVQRWATTQGFLPPLALDDDTIDDPHATPAITEQLHCIDEIAIERAMRGDRVPLTSPETTEAIARLAAMRLTDAEIGQRLHLSLDAVCQRRQRNGIASGYERPAKWRAA